MDNLERLQELAKERAELMQDLAKVTNDLRVLMVESLKSGELSELGAHKLTGVSRSVVRAWVGKP